jgi:hypothetical protein
MRFRGCGCLVDGTATRLLLEDDSRRRCLVTIDKRGHMTFARGHCDVVRCWYVRGSECDVMRSRIQCQSCLYNAAFGSWARTSLLSLTCSIASVAFGTFPTLPPFSPGSLSGPARIGRSFMVGKLGPNIGSVLCDG